MDIEECVKEISILKSRIAEGERAKKRLSELKFKYKLLLKEELKELEANNE